MKATVSVVRTGYGFKDIEVEIPDKQLKGKTKNEQAGLFAELALNDAGNHLFSEKNADYHWDAVTVDD